MINRYNSFLEVVTDVDTEEIVLVQTTTDSLTKEVHLLLFSNKRKCEFSPNTSEAVTKKSKLSEPVNGDIAKQTTYSTEVSVEDGQQQEWKCSAEVSENAILSENSSNGTKKESSLLNSQEQFQSLDPNTDILEKYQKLEKLYHKSEKLRIAMREGHKKSTKP